MLVDFLRLILDWIGATQKLKYERYLRGMESLQQKSYIARVTGATILSDILHDKFSDCDKSILRAFAAFLSFPPVFGGDIGGHKQGEIDYESLDTVIIVRSLRQYLKPGEKPIRQLHENSPFRVTKNSVDPNEKHPDYTRWLKVRGKPPDYSDL